MFYPSMPFSFGGTSMLILVVVTMDFMSQMQAHAMSHQYEGMMQKANLRNYGKGGQRTSTLSRRTWRIVEEQAHESKSIS